MGKILRINCPICDSGEYKVKFFRDFSQMLTIAPFKRYDVVKCKNCGMIYANNIEESVPLNDYYEKMSKYDGEYFVKFSNKRDRDYNQQIVNISSQHVKKDSAVLDVGCGAGGLLNCFKENGFNNLTGIEPSDKNCEFIKKTYNINAFNRSIGGGYDESLGKFDLICSIGVLEHILNLHEFLDEVLKYLSADGYLCLTVPDLEKFPETKGDFYQNFSVEHINFFNIHSLKNLLKVYNMDLVSYRQYYDSEKSFEPCLLSLWQRKNISLNNDFAIDEQGELSLEGYLSNCEKYGQELYKKIIPFKGRKIYIWGAGTFTAMMNQLNFFEGIDIAGIIDSNIGFRGKKMLDKIILNPQYDEISELPILICSQAMAKSILKDIRDKYCFKNEVITLSI